MKNSKSNFSASRVSKTLAYLIICYIIYIPQTNNLQLKDYFSINTKLDGPRSILAVSLKTGVETAYDRIPIQLLTFLKNHNPLVISDYEEQIGDFHLRDMMPLEKKRKTVPESRHSGSIAKDEQKPDEDTAGWKLDAWKNIPGFKVMQDQYPKSDYFAMLDDDTYLFVNNIETHLKTLDPTQKYYLGSPNMFVGCDGVKAFGEGPSFAHGGSGIVMSKATLKALVDGSDLCVEKYSGCWAGDIRTALCLRDQGILIDGDASKGAFNGHPPQKHNFNNACEKPFTFHHLFPNQVQFLYEMEQKIKKERGVDTLTTLGDIFEALVEKDGLFKARFSFNDKTEIIVDSEKVVVEYKKGFDMKGSDYEHYRTIFEKCVADCYNDIKCVSWTYVHGECWKKEGIPSPEEASDAKTGWFAHKFKCRKI